MKRVVITGAGAVSALGHDWTSVSNALQAKKNRVRYMHEWDRFPDLQTRLASPVDDFVLPAHYTAKKRRAMGRVAQMAVAASENALRDAGLWNDPIISSGATGVAYGSATGNSDAAMEFFGLLEHNSMAKINGTTYLRMMSHTAAVNISVLFGTCGRMYTTSSACTAGSQGIGFAFEAIRAGQQTIMIAGGAEELCPTQAAVFDTVYSASLRNGRPETAPRPFDTQRDGLVLGEGACTLILEEYEHALKRGANILAEVVGFATNCDGVHLVKPNPQTMKQVMQDALTNAGVNATDIGYISGHGTATLQGDLAESIATQEVMGSQIPFSALKSYIGHSLGACGSLEAWTTIQMMREKWFIPNLNLDELDPNCGQLDYIRGDVREIDTNLVMSNNFAFGGINTSLVFRRI